MLGVDERIFSKGANVHKNNLRALLASRIIRVVLAGLLTAATIFWLWEFGKPRLLASTLPNPTTQSQDSLVQSRIGRLHLLVPATSSNEDLCKLLLSAHVLGYPAPVLINYGQAEDHDDAYKQHLAKVEGILRYLDKIDGFAQHHDLILILDGWDIWLQLRPDVLLKRYYEANMAADERARQVYGSSLFDSLDMRQTILFGPDKLCWPVEYSRAACWAVPNPPLPEYAFGPGTSQIMIEQFMPRWLNSGTIMGPLQDLRKMFQATLDLIHNKHVTNSDQFYFAELFGSQGYSRLVHRPDLLEQARSTPLGIELATPDVTFPRLEPGAQLVEDSELHIGIDYKSLMFQTLAFYKQYLTFMRPVDSWKPARQLSRNSSIVTNQYAIELPDDIQKSPPPFEVLQQADHGLDALPSWSQVELLYNTVTRTIPVVIHFTGSGEKKLREHWWQRMHFQKQARALREATGLSLNEPLSSEPIAGRTFYKAEPARSGDVASRRGTGAWTDDGRWLEWSVLCESCEDKLYAAGNETFFHPAKGRNVSEQPVQ